MDRTDRIKEVKKILNRLNADGRYADNVIDIDARDIDKFYQPQPDQREALAKWLFEHKHDLPGQMFYPGWENEIQAAPITEKRYLAAADLALAAIEEGQ